MDGDEELLDELLDMFLQDFPARSKELKQALEENDAMLLAQRAHTIKGTSANIGAHALKDVAFEIEKTGNAGDLNLARTLVRKLESKFEKLQLVLSGPSV